MPENISQNSEKETLPLKPSFNEVGRSGTFVTSFEVQDDHLPELNGVAGQIQYAKMERSDEQIIKIMSAMLNPILSAKWSIDPASDDAIDLEAAALMEQVFFKDIPGGFKAKLDEILMFPFRGHSIFEPVFKNYSRPGLEAPLNQYTGLKNLAWRDQRTIDEWHFDDGELTQIHQLQQGDIEIDTYIPADQLIIFFFKKRGNDLGFPLLRGLYGCYKRKLLYKQLQAIGIERSAIPVPQVELPIGVSVNSSEYQQVEKQLQAFTNAESAYFIVPHGYKLTLEAKNVFDPAKVQAAIKAENEGMAGAVVGMFLEMGLGGNSGNQAGTEISADFFSKGLRFIADNAAEPLNNILIPQLCRMNFGDKLKKYPELKHAGISDDAGKELMDIVTGYVEKQVITPDEPLEDHVRKIHNLPKKAEGEQVSNMENEDDLTPPTEDDDPNTPPEDNPTPPTEDDDQEKELSTKKRETPKALMSEQGKKLTEVIRFNLQRQADKYIADVMNRYKQLPDNKKQNATNKVKIGFTGQFKKNISNVLTVTVDKAFGQVKSEVGINTELTYKNEKAIELMEKTYGDISEIKLNELSKYPTHIQVLIAKQAELLTESSTEELKNKIAFAFSGSETSTNDPEIIRQDLENAAKDHIEAASIDTKGQNAASLMINESRSTYFFEDDVLEEIHSFTFMNFDPKSAICTELAGTTFAANDVESLRYNPPLHHNCKSFLRANLKSSKGVDRLEITSLSPTAKAKKSITLNDKGVESEKAN